MVEEGLKSLGYESFRPGQERIVKAIMEGKDTLSIMPTGGGKSLCFQLPAILFPGVTVVISPLIALMQDQVMALIRKGVPAAYINSSLSRQQFELAMYRAKQGWYKIIYCAPERVLTEKFLEFAEAADVSLLVIDEAHCCSQWGHAFRQSYQGIPAFVDKLRKRPVIAAFTATATAEIQNDIIQMLGLKDPVLSVAGFDRPNLYFDVVKPKVKDKWLIGFLSKSKYCGLVYCLYRSTTENVAQMLRRAGHKAAHYHAGLEESEKHKLLVDFLSGKIKVLVSTTAFGMGIDKPDIRYVIHYDMPLNIEDYYQQAGRAGRDGNPADCILLYDDDAVWRNDRMLVSSANNAPVSAREAILERDRRRLAQMNVYATGHECYRTALLRYFGDEAAAELTEGCGNCGVCVPWAYECV